MASPSQIKEEIKGMQESILRSALYSLSEWFVPARNLVLLWTL